VLDGCSTGIGAPPGAIAGTGGALGLLLGGILTSYASWRWTLFINLAFAIAATIGALLWLANDREVNHDPFDLPGLFLVGIGLFSLVFGFSHAESTSWGNPYTIGPLVAAVVVLVLFVFVEVRAKYPLLPPRVVLDRTRGGSLLVMLCQRSEPLENRRPGQTVETTDPSHNRA
jgi:MFS family permease